MVCVVVLGSIGMHIEVPLPLMSRVCTHFWKALHRGLAVSSRPGLWNVFFNDALAAGKTRWRNIKLRVSSQQKA